MFPVLFLLFYVILRNLCSGTHRRNPGLTKSVFGKLRFLDGIVWTVRRPNRRDKAAFSIVSGGVSVDGVIGAHSP